MRRKLSFGVEKLSFGATQPQEMSALGQKLNTEPARQIRFHVRLRHQDQGLVSPGR